MLAKLFSMLEYSTTPLDTNPFTEQIVGEWSLPDEVCFCACPHSPVHIQHFCRSREMMKMMLAGTSVWGTMACLSLSADFLGRGKSSARR